MKLIDTIQEIKLYKSLGTYKDNNTKDIKGKLINPKGQVRGKKLSMFI